METRAGPATVFAELMARVVGRHPVKLTALLYLREALREERYEECADQIAIAMEFGAKAFEIQNLLEDPRRMPKG